MGIIILTPQNNSYFFRMKGQELNTSNNVATFTLPVEYQANVDFREYVEYVTELDFDQFFPSGWEPWREMFKPCYRHFPVYAKSLKRYLTLAYVVMALTY